jgi:DNA-directed RNA polymerase subunit RPC12/RpoP
MGPIERRLSESAKSIAQSKALEVGQIEREIERLRAEIVELEAKAELGRSAMERFERYRPQIEAVYQCPWCWMEFEKKQRLDMTTRKHDPHDFRSDGIMNCIYCGSDWPVPP